MNVARFISRRFLAAGMALALTPAVVFGDGAAASAVSVPEVGFSMVRMVGSLALVLAVFLGGVWLFRKWQRFCDVRGNGPRLQIVEARSLSNRHTLYVVGYEKQRLLVASSPAGVTLVANLPEEEVKQQDPETSPAFASVLAAALQRVVKPKP